MAYNIVSLNCNGIRDNNKRKQLFLWLNDKKYDIIFLQETHSTPADEISWKHEWGGEIFYSHGISNKRGVAILIKSQTCLEVKALKCHDGRSLLLDTMVGGKNVLMVNIYGPNNDDVVFFQTVMADIIDMECLNVIIGGDFNLVLNIDVDKKGGIGRTHTKCNEYLINMMENLQLKDIWRIQHPNINQYTWRRRNPSPIQCRLDMFLVTESLQGCIDTSIISPSFRSDHSLVGIKCTFTDISRGPGYWKLNCSLLRDINYINNINTLIDQYNNNNTITSNGNTDPRLIWEVLKMEIRKHTIKYSSVKKREQIAEQRELEHVIHSLEIKESLTNDEYIILNNSKERVKKMYDNKVRGAMIRSRTQNYEDGDRPSKYFLNLEKNRQAKKSIYKLVNKHGEMINNKQHILREVNDYYKALYTSNNCIETVSDRIKNEFLPVPGHIKLTEKLKQSCEGEITSEEILEALKLTKNNKSPGIDGLPYEFYKTFWCKIKEYLMNSINYSYEHGEMSINQRRGVISLLPKGNKDVHYLSNWRPITLLCCDYKLISKVLSTRVKNTLQYLIHSSQTGFVRDRYIGENIITILQLIENAEEEDTPGMILSADFTKAFDNLDWGYLENVLKYFNFGESFIKWIHILNKNVTAVVNVNGWFTSYFNIEKGARQGDPIAPYLFILSVEMLGHKFRMDNTVKGIIYGNIEYKISQFADDTIIFLDGTALSLNSSLDILHNFSLLSRLHINLEKTKVFKIGQLRNKAIEIQTRHHVEWSNGPLETLGIKISIQNRNMISQINYDPKLNEMELVFKRWLNRKLSLRGKATIIKTYGISKLTYLASLLPQPPKYIIEKIEQIIFNFLWEGKRNYIKKDILINNYEMGGLNIPHFQTICVAQKIAWAKRYLALDNISQWGSIVNNILKHLGGKFLFRCNLTEKDIAHLHIKSDFWINVLKSWCQYTYLDTIQNSDIKEQIIWLNSKIRVDNKPLLNLQCIQSQFWQLKQLYEDGLLLDRNMINIIYNMNISVMQYNSMICAIPQYWHRHMRRGVQGNDQIHVVTPTDNFSKITSLPQKLVSKFVKSEIIKQKSVGLNLEKKWEQHIPTNPLNNSCFLHIEKITIDNVLRSFQFRILHRIIFFNDKLYLFNIVNNAECDFCHESVDSIEHRLWQCKVSQQIWKDILDWYNTITNSHATLNYYMLISNICTSELLEFVVLSTKYYIYKCFLSKNKPTLPKLIIEIKLLELIEKDIAIRKNKILTHENKWQMLATTDHRVEDISMYSIQG